MAEKKLRIVQSTAADDIKRNCVSSLLLLGLRKFYYWVYEPGSCRAYMTYIPPGDLRLVGYTDDTLRCVVL